MNLQEISLKELMETGAHFGHQSRRWNPKMKQYIYQTRDNIHVIDLAQTAQGLKEACEYIQSLVSAGGSIMFVGTKRQAKDLVRSAAITAGLPFVSERWVGGMLTNWDTILKNIQRLKEYKRQGEAGELLRYTKKEQSLIAKEVERLEKIYEGLLDLTKIPDAVFVVDVRKEKIAVKEAVRRGIPVIAICDTNSDPSSVDIVIPANDDAIKSVEYILDKVAQAAISGRSAKGEDKDVVSIKAKKDSEEETVEAKPKKTRKATKTE